MSYLHFTSGTQVFWWLRLLHGIVYKSFIRPQSFLGKLRTSCEVSFFYLQFGSKYDRLRHADMIMHSRIWFELSDLGANPPHVTRKVIQNRPSFSHVWGGAGHETIFDWSLLRFEMCTCTGTMIKLSIEHCHCGEALAAMLNITTSFLHGAVESCIPVHFQSLCEFSSPVQ